MAGLSAALLYGLGAASTISQSLGSRRQGRGAERAANLEASLLETNAGYAEQQARDATARGAEAEGRHRARTSGLVGSQRASAAAQGLDVSSGDARALTEETAALGELDALTIRNNARREAWGYRVEASGLRQRAELTRRGGRNAAAAGRSQMGTTLLTGGAQLYDIYRKRR